MRLPSCRECGLCCCHQTDGDGYISLNEDDIQRLGRRARKRVEHLWYGESPVFFIERPVGVYGFACPFLRGQPGKRVSCRIYDRRPAACQDFKRGGPVCKEVLRYHGLGGKK